LYSMIIPDVEGMYTYNTPLIRLPCGLKT
jgi:hypothetical protein